MQDQKDLKNAGLKATLPRLKVLSLFESSKERHLSAEDIYKVMINSGEDVGLATVYRVLTQFEQAGLLIRHHFEGVNRYLNSMAEVIMTTSYACNVEELRSFMMQKLKKDKKVQQLN